MAAMAESSYGTVNRQQAAVNRSFHSFASSEEKEHEATAQIKQQLIAATSPHEEYEPGKSLKNCTEEKQLHRVLDSTKHKHYRRRRSSFSIKLSKPAASMELQQQAEATQLLTAWQKDQNQQTQLCAAIEQDENQTLEQIKNQEKFNASPAAEQQHAIVIHKPQPLPLRPNLLMPGQSGVSCTIKLLFDREHEALLQWHKKDFHAFTEEVQESLGGMLKKHIREYGSALELLRQQLRRTINADPLKPGMTPSPSSSSPKEDEHHEGKDDVLKARQNHSCNYVRSCSNEGARHLMDFSGSGRPQVLDGAKPIQSRKERPRSEKIDSETASAILEELRFQGDRSLLQEMQEDRIENVLNAFVKARDAVVSVREVAQRIEEHKSWMQLELNLTRLEVMNLRFCRSNSPRAVLREAMELAATVRSFILELTSAIDCNELGVHWPYPRKADCSDVTPLFIKHLVNTVPAATSS